jgi:nitroreductase
MEKETVNRFPLDPLLRRRWSPRAFSETPVEKEKIQSLFEAARWTPSSGNEQPWRFLVGMRGDETWQKIWDTLDDTNQPWNSRVPLLLVSIGKKIRTRSGNPNFHYQYDTGQSVAHLTIEAMSLGLWVHQMAGFDKDKIAADFNVPAEYQPMTAIAIGYPGDPELLENYQKEREFAARTRKDFSEFVFSGTFGNSLNVFITDIK